VKTFKCTICGEEVSKRKSLAVEGGRACRTHDLPKKEPEDNKILLPAARQIPRRKFVEAKNFLKTLLDLNYDPAEADHRLGPPSTHYHSLSRFIPFHQMDAFMEQMIEDGLVKKWMGGYADARYFNDDTISEEEATKRSKEFVDEFIDTTAALLFLNRRKP
jgi:hypothetical protein